MNVAVLGPGGVGGLVAGALARAGTAVTVVAREETAGTIARGGLQVRSVRLGAFHVHPPAVAALETEADALLVAVKQPDLEAALERVRAEPRLVVPLLDGVEHLAVLRARFGAGVVVAGAIRIAAERPQAGHVHHWSPLTRIELAPERADVTMLSHVLRMAELPTQVRASEADVIWRRLAAVAPLGLVTAASGLTIGEARGHPRWRLQLAGAVDETAAVARAEGAGVEAGALLTQLAELHPELRSALARDVAAGGPNELDAIGGAVLRAAARHGLETPAVARLVKAAAERVA